jgi:hypothetical protein
MNWVIYSHESSHQRRRQSDCGETMTDPKTLTHDQLVQYVGQLQQTVQFWQNATARSRGITVEEMFAIIKGKPAKDLVLVEYMG